MAKAISNLDLAVMLGNLTAYRRRGSDKLILRRPGGPSKKQIMEDYNFDETRKNMSDFGACTKATKGLRDAILPLLHLGDPNFTGRLNQLFKKIQHMPSGTLRGARSIPSPGTAIW